MCPLVLPWLCWRVVPKGTFMYSLQIFLDFFNIPLMMVGESQSACIPLHYLGHKDKIEEYLKDSIANRL